MSDDTITLTGSTWMKPMYYYSMLHNLFPTIVLSGVGEDCVSFDLKMSRTPWKYKYKYSEDVIFKELLEYVTGNLQSALFCW